MVRSRKRRVGAAKSNNSRGKFARLLIYLSLIFMICFLVAFFVYREKIGGVSDYIKIHDLVDQDKKIHQKKEKNRGRENIQNSNDSIGKNVNLKLESESVDPEYKEEDKNYLDKIIKRN